MLRWQCLFERYVSTAHSCIFRHSRWLSVYYVVGCNKNRTTLNRLHLINWNFQFFFPSIISKWHRYSEIRMLSYYFAGWPRNWKTPYSRGILRPWKTLGKLREYLRKSVQPQEKIVTDKIMSPDAVSGMQKCSKIRLPGMPFCPLDRGYLPKGACDVPPDYHYYNYFWLWQLPPVEKLAYRSGKAWKTWVFFLLLCGHPVLALLRKLQMFCNSLDGFYCRTLYVSFMHHVCFQLLSHRSLCIPCWPTVNL